MLIPKDAMGVEIQPGDFVAFPRKGGQVTGTVELVVVRTSQGYNGIMNSTRVHVNTSGSFSWQRSVIRNTRNLLIIRKWDFE